MLIVCFFLGGVLSSFRRLGIVAVLRDLIVVWEGAHCTLPRSRETCFWTRRCICGGAFDKALVSI